MEALRKRDEAAEKKQVKKTCAKPKKDKKSPAAEKSQLKLLLSSSFNIFMSKE